MSDRDSTLAEVPDHRRSRLAAAASRTFVVLLFVVCVAGGVGLLGGRTATASTGGDGYQLTLSYPGTVRPGLDTFWELRVVHQGGFAKSITIAVTGSYFDLFETQGFYPTPAATTRDATYVYMTFKPPKQGDTFTVMFDSYLQPYVAPTHLLAQHARVELVNHAKPLVVLPFTTWVLP